MAKKLPLSYIELSSENLKRNLIALRGIVKSGTQIAVAVKGNAYGHGQKEIVKIAEKYTDYFIVNSIEELKVLREISKKPVLVFGYVFPEFLSDAILNNCILGVFSEKQFFEIEKVAKKLKKKQSVHVACDSLLGREGFLEEELAGFFAHAQKKPTRKKNRH